MKKALLVLLLCAAITVNTACSKSDAPKENVTDASQTETVMSGNSDENAEDPTLDVKPEEKPEIEPEVKPEEKPEVEPTAKPTEKPAAKPTPKPATKPTATPKPTPKPETKPETKPTPKPEDSILKGELKNIIEKIYSSSEVKLPKTELKEVTSENEKYYLGTNNVQYVEALASEPLIGSFAHSLVLIRVKDGADINKIKTEIKDNVDPRKWICVGVEPEKVIVDNIDNLIVLIMDNESEKLHKAFLSLAK